MFGVWVSISSDSLPAGYSTIRRTALAARDCCHHFTERPRRVGHGEKCLYCYELRVDTLRTYVRNSLQ